MQQILPYIINGISVGGQYALIAIQTGFPSLAERPAPPSSPCV